MPSKPVFIALVALLGATGNAASFNPMRNPGLNKCIQYGAYNGYADQYALKLGSCTDAQRRVPFTHVGNGKALKSQDGHCLSASGNSIILDVCTASLGQRWTKVGVRQWRNGNNLCLEYAYGDKLVQVCQALGPASITFGSHVSEAAGPTMLGPWL